MIWALNNKSLIVKHFKRFNILDDNDFQKSLDANKNYDDNIYYIRKNVANGIIGIKYSNSNSEKKLCCNKNKSYQIKFFESIRKLNWHRNDLVGESCELIKKKTILVPDFHDGPRVDLTSTLVHLGQRPILLSTKYDKSPFPESLMLSEILYNLSNYIKHHKGIGIDMNKEYEIKENFEYYKNLEVIKSIDYVICSFIVSVCEAFIPLNKTIIFNPAHRYNLNRCSVDSWLKLNENYFKLKAKSKLVVSAMSKYDIEYQSHFTGLRGYRLYAYGGYYAKNVNYNPIKKQIIVGPSNGIASGGLEIMKELNL